MAKKSKKVNQFDLDEIFRHLRTNIEFSQLDNDMRMINILSTNPHEGKTTVATHLAQIFADKYPNVLLVDCDLRKPNDHKQLGVSNKIGLTNLLTHYNSGQSIKQQPEVQKLKMEDGGILHFISTGSKVPNPTEIISSRKYSDFLRQAKKEFDFVVVDCPPILAVSDGVPISVNCDGTIFVISSKETDKRKAKMAIQDLKRNGANILGAVLTKVPGFGESRYGYGYGYGYGLGENNK